LVSIENISFEFGARWLFKNASLQIKPGDRMALVGRNGTGKTTLLRLIVGEYGLAEGKINFPKDLKIGFLKQELSKQESQNSVLDVALEAFEAQLRLQRKVESLLKALEQEYTEKAALDLASAQAEFEALGGYSMNARAAAMLAGLGFSDEDQQRPLSSFSGGWRMRVFLCQLLLRDPDLLLLDEPTNHLDLPSILWLENYLRSFRGAYVIVSHDRFFLDRLCEITVEVDQAKLNYYKGNYTYFLEEKEIRREQQLREFENQQKVISDMERFINRFRAKATKARQAQSKIKMLDKIERIEAPEGDADSVNFEFRPSVTPGKTILEIAVAEKRYGDKRILGESTATLYRGDKVALVGANGLGKSTLLRMLASMEPFDGSVDLGHNVMPSFFAQHQSEALKPTNSILEEMDSYVRQKGETFVRNILGGFLFTGDDIFKKIKVLSGGEKSRVALAKTLLSEANFLLLDEPTNHLDISSIEILIYALQAYEGTFIVVSHDRYFLGEVANKIWYIKDRQVKEYPGTYQEFEEWQSKQAEEEKADAKIKADAATAAKAQVLEDSGVKKESYEDRKEKARQLRKLENEVERAEKAVNEAEAKKASILERMALPEIASDFAKIGQLQTELRAVEDKIEESTLQWLTAQEELEKANR
jgi:ATP-binding cassette subfamily F protein 3